LISLIFLPHNMTFYYEFLHFFQKEEKQRKASEESRIQDERMKESRQRAEREVTLFPLFFPKFHFSENLYHVFRN